VGGSNDCHALGLGESVAADGVGTELGLGPSVAVGDSVTLPRRVFGIGPDKDQSLFGQLPAGEAVVGIACGDAHMVAVTATSTFAWGWNRLGQCGVGHTHDVPSPQRVSVLDAGDGGLRCVQAACGAAHTVLAVKTPGGETHAVAFGLAAQGQLGHVWPPSHSGGASDDPASWPAWKASSSATPFTVPLPRGAVPHREEAASPLVAPLDAATGASPIPDVRMVACGVAHTAIVTWSGRVVLCGQLVPPDTSVALPPPFTSTPLSMASSNRTPPPLRLGEAASSRRSVSFADKQDDSAPPPPRRGSQTESDDARPRSLSLGRELVQAVSQAALERFESAPPAHTRRVPLSEEPVPPPSRRGSLPPRAPVPPPRAKGPLAPPLPLVGGRSELTENGNTVGVGPVWAWGIDGRDARFVACGGGHTCITVAAGWLEDSLSPHCLKCHEPFRALRQRRHHCRSCGGIFCDRCSATRMPLLQLGHVDPVRVCDACAVRNTMDEEPQPASAPLDEAAADEPLTDSLDECRRLLEPLTAALTT
jgi:hypothetical protein